MKLNSSTALISSKILLVPYEPHHVSTYHEWMEDEEIREATASDRLTLDMEYEMQKRWRQDADKLTFISCIPPVGTGGGGVGGVESILAGRDDAPERMVGDVNLFLFDEDEEGSDGGGGGGGGSRRVVGEVELMIARKRDQGKGLGRASVLLFLYYVLTRRSEVVAARPCGPLLAPELAALRVKINRSNVRSIGLFESLGFVKRSEEPNYFGEIELVMEDLDVEKVVERMRGCGIEGWGEAGYRHS